MSPLPGIPQRVKMVGGTPVPLYPDECEPHTPHPDGYVPYFEWMRKMERTHVQRQCRGCGLWSVWEPRDG